MAQKTYTGSCHCGKVRYQADVDLAEGSSRCNCSICQKSRQWGTKANYDTFQLLSDPADLADYQWNSDKIHNYFCKHCGVRTHGMGYIEEIGGNYCSVQLVTLDDVSDEELAGVAVTYCDGRGNNWWNEPSVKSYL